MNPVRAELLEIAIPFRFAFRHALAERDEGEGLLLTLHDGDGRSGHGECTPRSYVSGESVRSVMDALERRLPRVLGRRWSSFDELCQDLATELAVLPREEHAAFCALELALLDLGGRVFGRSAGEPLGPIVNRRVAYSGVVSAGGKDEARKVCEWMKELGVTRAKVKVGSELADDLEVLTTVREVMGPKAELRADANCAWDAATALERVTAFSEFDLLGLEQPCAADDVDGMAWLTARSSVPIVADESLVSVDDARRLAEARACHVFNVRVSKCGGLLSSGRIRDLGRAAGIDTMLGAHVGETAILAAAGRQLAARTANLRFAEGSYGRLLLEADVSDALDLEPGAVGAAPAGDGLGLEVDLERIDSFVTARRTLESGG